MYNASHTARWARPEAEGARKLSPGLNGAELHALMESVKRIAFSRPFRANPFLDGSQG